MHSERMDDNQQKVTYEDDARSLPDGTFIKLNDEPYLILNGEIHLWTPFGYETGKPIPAPYKFEVLTPRSTVNTFRAGYLPQINIKAE
jgi:hypothetical protein